MSQGEPYWLDDDEPFGSEPGYRRPWVVVQNQATNQTRIQTVLACPLSSTMRLAAAPGNVRLSPGEGGLTRECVVIVSGVSAKDRVLFLDPIGNVSNRRVLQIVSGILLLMDPATPEP